MRVSEFMTRDAVALAKERGLDLIEVAPNARPPVCRVADFGRLKYEKSKKDAAARKNQVKVTLKEVKLRPKTDDHDMDVKTRHARRFLEAGVEARDDVRDAQRKGVADQLPGRGHRLLFAFGPGASPIVAATTTAWIKSGGTNSGWVGRSDHIMPSSRTSPTHIGSKGNCC